MDIDYVPREEFTALLDALDAAPTTGTFPPCRKNDGGFATKQASRSNPDMWMVFFSCGHVVAAAEE